MYEKDKLTRITLRLNQEQFDFVKASADVLGVSPSEFLRLIINVTLSASRKIPKSETDPSIIGSAVASSTIDEATKL